MRIIAGKRARYNLLPPKDNTTRPITDRVKEALFSILMPQIPGRYVADLFCGTGSLGLEAVSRGAIHAIMVDRDREAVSRLKQNIAKLQFEAETSVQMVDSFKVGIPTRRPGLAKLPSEEPKVNLVFLDPPYRLAKETELESQLGKLLIKVGTQVAPGAIVVVRHEAPSELLESYGDLFVYDKRKYGKMLLTFLKTEGVEE